jgi:hypothetical protein
MHYLQDMLFPYTRMDLQRKSSFEKETGEEKWKEKKTCQEGSAGPSHPSKCWHLVQLSPEAPCLPLAPQALTISITTTAKCENLEKKQW